LAEQGWTKEEIEALPSLQAVVVYFLDSYNQTRDDMLKWLHAPPWQARVKIDELARAAQKVGQPGNGNPFIQLMLPASPRCTRRRRASITSSAGCAPPRRCGCTRRRTTARRRRSSRTSATCRCRP